jgi:quercetin 2,3-dioxygenase
MITVRKSNERGHADHGWLDSHHTFSFADYYDPEQTHFRDLRVINEDRVAPEMGFGMHPHRNMEIITYVIAGALRHSDSMGNSAILRAGDVQRISAGTGITHSEVNASSQEPVHFLQIWLFPDKKDAKPGYAEKSFAKAERGQLHFVASKSGANGSLTINQDKNLYLGKLDKDNVVKQAIGTKRHAWLQLITGDLDVNGTQLKPGDAAAISDTDALTIPARQSSDFLLFDLN